ncbi:MULTISPECIES: hypothetical protein [Rhizobium]|uniref:Uncharacterized protein n=1 Tax=Rhizobium paranaense TaxID=1650438 RepID=A0A7W8XQV5_9HYPH|nr:MULTISPECIES: hypothetical protein [Rhizobium]MBB5573929.1 hypothetical protein [Rhizobium paranaense]PST61357.1 hypothetical protein C9E91_18245 [Rhizobium sp. SEMIA4064]
MIRGLVLASKIPLQNDDIEICQRVFDQICVEKGIKDDERCEELAASIIDFYQHGVKNEASLKRLFF